MGHEQALIEQGRITDPPRPAGRPMVRMRWEDLLFVHWRVEARRLREVLPAGLEPDELDGSAWVGLVPFTMPRFCMRGITFPGAGAFHECNVRTYVNVDGEPGVYFFSLDAASRLAVCGARRVYGLPYFHADIQLQRDGQQIDYRLRRRGGQGEVQVAWEPGEALPASQPGSLEWFLTERYCLYRPGRRGIDRARIWHRRWRLREARLLQLEQDLTSAAGIELHHPPASFLASDGTEALAWAPRSAGDASA